MATSVMNVAAYILQECGSMTHVKLQKLVYYSQAWSLVWDEEPLFKQPIEAWINGPVVPHLFRKLRQMYKVSQGDLETGDPDRLTECQAETVDAVLKYYGDKSAQWLSDLTHSEQPWRKSREGLAPNERGHNEIPHARMAWYYSSLSEA